MAGPANDDRRSDNGDHGQPRNALRQLWETQFASNRPARASRAPVFVALWALLAGAVTIASVVSGDAGWPLGFLAMTFGLVLATLTGTVRDEFRRWVAPLNLLALVILVAGAAILWST